MTRLVHSKRPAIRLCRSLTTVHTFGSLAIALYDGRLLAVAVATPDFAFCLLPPNQVALPSSAFRRLHRRSTGSNSAR
jgi:hypothetical protein